MTAPLYEALATYLRRAISTGTYGPGHHLPSESDLRAEHGVSRSTIRRALDQLQREGLIYSDPRRGWFVREIRPLVWRASRPERNVRTDVSPMDSWSLDVRDQGREPGEQISVTIETAQPRIAERLQIQAGEPVVVRKRHRFVDGDLFLTADTYYPHELVAGSVIAQPKEVLPGVWHAMEELGHGWDDACRRDETSARPAGMQEAATFGVSAGTPLIEHIRTRRTSEGRPVAVMITVAPGDRMVIVYEQEAEQ